MKLKNCPFCGGKAEYYDESNAYVEHLCPIFGSGADNLTLRATDWNKRPLEDAARAEALEEHIKVLEDMPVPDDLYEGMLAACRALQVLK